MTPEAAAVELSAPVYGRWEGPRPVSEEWAGEPGPGAPGYLPVDGELRPVWVVPVVQRDPPATGRQFVDARTGEVWAVEATSRTARAVVYPVSPAESELEEVELAGLVDPGRLAGERVIARSCDDAELSASLVAPSVCWASSSHAEPDAAGDYVFAPDPVGADDPFAEVQLYWHVDRALAWLTEDLGLDLPTPITAHANFAWANAFYGDFDGDGAADVSFGEAEGVDLAYDADVVTHELGHAAVASLAPQLPLVSADAWGLEWAGGAVNEGAADVFAALRGGDPQIGEYGGGALGQDGPVRDLSEVRRCPDDLRGEVHDDGRIFGSFGWRVTDEVGGDVAEAVLLGAIPRWGPGVSWDAIGQSVRATTEDLFSDGAIGGTERDHVLALLAESGMEGCPRVVPLDDGRVVSLTLFNGGLVDDLARLPAGVELSLEVPADARAVSVEVSGFDAPAGFGWALFGRWGEPVEHDHRDLGGMGLGWATPAVWDWTAEGDGDARIAAPVVAPGETLYLSVASVNEGELPLLVAAFGELEVRASAARGGGLPRDHGCGCASGGFGSGWAVLVLLAAAVRATIPRHHR